MLCFYVLDVIVFVGLNNFMDDFMDGMFSNDVSNGEIKKLLERILTRFENWRIEVERNPNPHMVHQLKNLVTIVDNVSSVVEEKKSYSYKQLASQMALMMKDAADLNLAITESLKADDSIDEKESLKIKQLLMSMIENSLGLMQIIQGSFGATTGIPLSGEENMLLDSGKVSDGTRVSRVVSGED